MKFNTKIRYGIRTMISIASNENQGEGILQKDIARNQDISVKYLDHIISALKTNGLIKTKSGRKSGYVLTRPPEKITMLDIHNAFEPGIEIIECLDPECECPKKPTCSPHEFWKGLNNNIEAYFKSYTLQNLIEESMP